jgi:hypothetical protein
MVPLRFLLIASCSYRFPIPLEYTLGVHAYYNANISDSFYKIAPDTYQPPLAVTEDLMPDYPADKDYPDM